MTQIQGFGSNLPLVDYQPVDEAARQKIQQGNFGNIQSVVFEKDYVTVVTDLGTLRFNGPQLQQPPTNLTGNDFYNAQTQIDDLGHAENLTDIFDIMKLFHELAMRSRESSRQIRHAERDMMVNAILDQADKIREAAAWQLAAGVISGVVQIASGAISVGGACKALKAPTQIKADSFLKKSQGLASITQGLGQLITAPLQYNSELAKADQKELEADEKVHETHAQDESQWMQNMMDVIKDTRQKIDEIIRAQQDSLKSIIRA